MNQKNKIIWCSKSISFDFLRHWVPSDYFLGHFIAIKNEIKGLTYMHEKKFLSKHKRLMTLSLSRKKCLNIEFIVLKFSKRNVRCFSSTLKAEIFYFSSYEKKESARRNISISFIILQFFRNLISINFHLR